eukprot:TRINITY_DN54500_c0_g1_i1.p1 TRINITY_DN54500_c0_g1~~TRINITY_DN54500_c0_g1_i1.p1  ORF type:complete len:189 (+),score=48.78 TRINITY_DN54500_c0_g1_i1:90-656(+)
MVAAPVSPADHANVTGHKKLQSPEVSPVPSSVCPTESTAPGEADLHDCDSGSEASAILEGCEEDEDSQQPDWDSQRRCVSEARNWSKVSERMRRVFMKLAEEESSEDEDMENSEQAASAFRSVLQSDACSTEQATFDCSSLPHSKQRKSSGSPQWQSVGLRVARVLQEEHDEIDGSEASEEAEAEPEP